jgi:DNA-binding NarL/FixJ family response regulator
MHGEKEVFQAALDLGVKGYVLKDSATTEIVAAIKSVAENRPFFSSSLSGLLLNRRRNVEDFESENQGINQLTATERRILKLVAEEKTSKEIGEQLFTSHRTIEKHRANISRKLGLQGSLALVKFALAHKSEL